MAIKCFRDLKVWQQARVLAQDAYRLSLRLPGWERYELARQIRSAARSVAFNIAEGHGREHLGDYVHHLSIASGSLAEFETQIIHCGDVGYLTDDECRRWLEQVEQLSRMLAALTRVLKRRTHGHLAPRT